MIHNLPLSKIINIQFNHIFQVFIHFHCIETFCTIFKSFKCFIEISEQLKYISLDCNIHREKNNLYNLESSQDQIYSKLFKVCIMT